MVYDDAKKVLEQLVQQQKMVTVVTEKATAFRKESAQLKEAYEAFLNKLRRDGRYKKLVSKYYPLVEEYFPAFFHRPE